MPATPLEILGAQAPRATVLASTHAAKFLLRLTFPSRLYWDPSQLVDPKFKVCPKNFFDSGLVCWSVAGSSDW